MEHVIVMVPGTHLCPYRHIDLEYADDAAIFAINQKDVALGLTIFDAEAPDSVPEAAGPKLKS